MPDQDATTPDAAPENGPRQASRTILNLISSL
jgi:hypothetical protein